jgi:hypothetical protein
VQSSAALLEKQRNPGVGYWTTRTSESSPSDTATTTATASSPIAGSPSAKNEEQMNIEYLRNVILQFLEHKEMRVSPQASFEQDLLTFPLSAKPRTSTIHHLTVYTTGDPSSNVQSLIL